MEVKQVAALPKRLEVMDIEMSDDVLTITAVSIQAHPACPLCGKPSTRVHSHYMRKVADLPMGGRRVRLLVQVRKCFCDAPDCVRKIFVERLTPFVDTFARVTQRLFHIVQIIGLATGGRLGMRVTERLEIQTSRHTILRRIMALPTEPVGDVSQIGIDDFSFRRGRKFGTIVVDLQTHKMLDVLPDRTADTSAAWMAAHPELDIVSRDRGGDYATAARQGAPQAIQIADRFHVYKNLSEAVELALAHCRAEIRKKAEAAVQEEAEAAVQQLLEENAKTFSLETWKPTPGAPQERARLTRREQRSDKYQQVRELHARGLIQAEIAHRTGVSQRTVRRWLKTETFPEMGRRRKRPSIFDPYSAYVLKRWEEGCRNGLQLLQEAKALGYTGSYTSFSRFLLPLREQQQSIRHAQTPQILLQDFSAKKVVWLIVRDPTDLDEKEKETLAILCQMSETASTIYQLVQEFRYMLHHREGAKLDEWLEKVRTSQIRELQSFVVGVERDKAAVVAGLTLSQSNGLVEGKVNKLKLIKRMGYGRAGFPLLRQRVLHAL